MDWWESKDDCAIKLLDEHSIAFTNAILAYGIIDDAAYEYWYGSKDVALELSLVAIEAVLDIIHHRLFPLTGFINGYWQNGLLYYIINHTTPSFTSILNTMMTASPAELDEWGAITEAFKAAIWDKPFLESTYAELVRHFKQWE